MPPLPSLTQAFSQLGKQSYGGSSPYSVLNGPVSPSPQPAIPNIFGGIGGFISSAYNKGSQILSGNAPRAGVSSAAALGMAPAIPSLTPNATSTATKQPVYIPPAVQPTPNATSVVTKAPVYGPSAPAVPNATSIATKQPTYGPTAPPVPSTGPSTTANSSTFAAPVTAPSGNVVDPNTGSIISTAPALPTANLPITGDNTGNSSGATDYSSSAGGAPGIYGGNGSMPTSVGDILSAYLKSLNMSDQEVADQKRLNDLNTASAQAYTNTENQPIALPFITGQQAALQRESSTLAAPIQSSLALAQAQRQASSEGLSKILDFTKPISTTYGGTLSRLNPATGQYETVVNPFGSASGTASGTGTDVTKTIGDAIANGQLTQDQVTRYGIPFIAATLASDPGYNFITQKAGVTSDTASLKTQQAYADSTSRAFDTANANLSQLVGFMTANGVNQSTVPAINQLNNRMKSGLTDAGTIAAFQAALAGLRAEYAQVLSRGGEVTEGQRSQANALIPDDISPAQLQQVTDRLKIEGTNAITEANAKVADIKKRIGSNSGSSSNSSSTSAAVGTSWDNL